MYSSIVLTLGCWLNILKRTLPTKDVNPKVETIRLPKNGDNSRDSTNAMVCVKKMEIPKKVPHVATSSQIKLIFENTCDVKFFKVSCFISSIFSRFESCVPELLFPYANFGLFKISIAKTQTFNKSPLVKINAPITCQIEKTLWHFAEYVLIDLHSSFPIFVYSFSAHTEFCEPSIHSWI